MRTVKLTPDDMFELTRCLVHGSAMGLRRISDVHGEVLTLRPDSRLDAPPLSLNLQETRAAARRTAAFFSLDPAEAASLEELDTLGQWRDHVLAFAGLRPTHIGFATSGSTGRPKTIVRDYRHLEQDAHWVAEIFAGAERLHMVAPPVHILGFINGLMVPKVLGVPLLDRRFQSPLAIAQDLRPHDRIVTTPMFWGLLAAAVERFPPDVVGLSSGAPCSTELFTVLAARGLTRLHDAYGSSECGPVAERTAGDEPYRLVPMWRRGDALLLNRVEPDGTESGPYPIQDRLEWLDEHRFRVLGRLDEAVQVAGVNVFPSRAAETLRAHEWVADCAVRLMRPNEGDRLKAFVVLKPGISPDKETEGQLCAHLETRLSHLEMPRTLTFGPAIPRNAMGKLEDW